MTIILATVYKSQTAFGTECVKTGATATGLILEGLRRLGLDASDCIAFEDSAAGIQSATSARLYTFGLCTSRPPADLM